MNEKLSRRAFLMSSAAALLSLAACRVGLPAASGPTGEEGQDASASTPESASEGIYRAPPLAPEDVGTEDRIERSEQEWQALLSQQQYYVVRQKGTERAYTGAYTNIKAEGIYHCVACGNPLFGSDTKYDSGTGWPSFWAPLEEGRLRTETDASLGFERTEVLCARCGAHLGHVFQDGPPPTGLRYCMNSIALNFAPSSAASSAPADEAADEAEPAATSATKDEVTSPLEAEPATDQGEEPMTREEKTLFAFEGQDEATRWARVDDVVMGGLSESNLTLTDQGTALFEGILSLENFGGFTSVRTYPYDFGLSGYDGLVVRVKGDGRPYMLRVRVDNRLDGPAYEAGFETVADTWVTIEVPFRDFVSTFRGRRLRNAPVLQGAAVQQIGFMLADKRAGPFRLEIDWVKAYADSG